MKWFKIKETIKVDASIQKIKVNNQTICLINTNGKYLACNAKCPHAGADLSNGWIENNQIVCPFHRHKYDLNNGRGADGQGDYLPIYKIEKGDDGLYIELPQKWWKRLFRI
jgi:nitrite reductase/ring-hydroxylating ferredoxin subunit